MGANSEDLVDKIFDRDDTELIEILFDERVVSQGDALPVDLAISALVLFPISMLSPRKIRQRKREKNVRSVRGPTSGLALRRRSMAQQPSASQKLP